MKLELIRGVVTFSVNSRWDLCHCITQGRRMLPRLEGRSGLCLTTSMGSQTGDHDVVWL